jgi:serine protease Do
MVAPAVVAVDTSAVGLDFFRRPVAQRGAGSGVIIRKDGYIVTNAHVIRGATDVSVALADGRVYPAEVVGRDDPSDLAVLRIEASDLPALAFADSNAATVGDWVIALGNALGLDGGPTVTVGIISALGRQIDTGSGVPLSDLIQTDAAINEGNSGGPLVNLDGEIVGLNTSIIAGAQGIGFSINSATVERFTNDLIDQGRVRRPLIGISGRTLTPARAAQLRLSVDTGVLVTSTSSGPAADAGIRAGDVIQAIDDRDVASWGEFLSHLWSHRPGETLDLSVIRGGERLTVPVVLTERG